MKPTHLLHLLTICSLLMMHSCTTKSDITDSVPYQLADNYFFRNDAPDTTNPIICNTLEEFEQYYGYAAVMGKNGQPTPIDFNKHTTIGIVLPVTNHETYIHPTDLLLDNACLTLHFKLQTDEQELSFSLRPMILLIVDKENVAKAKSFEIQQD